METENVQFTVLLLDMATWEPSKSREIVAHVDVISRLEMHDATLFTASYDNTVKVWRVPPSGNVTLVRVLDCCLPTSLAPLQISSPSLPTAASEAFVSASLDGVIRRWSDGRDTPDEEVTPLSRSI